MVQVVLAGSQQTEKVGRVEVWVLENKKNSAGKYNLLRIGWTKFAPDTANNVSEKYNSLLTLKNTRRISVRSCIGGTADQKCQVKPVWNILSRSDGLAEARP